MVQDLGGKLFNIFSNYCRWKWASSLILQPPTCWGETLIGDKRLGCTGTSKWDVKVKNFKFTCQMSSSSLALCKLSLLLTVVPHDYVTKSHVMASRNIFNNCTSAGGVSTKGQCFEGNYVFDVTSVINAFLKWQLLESLYSWK